MTGVPLRIRLTAMVTGVFALALVVLAFVGLNRMQAALRADTERNAEALLVEYFDDLSVGEFDSATSGPLQVTRFEYLDENGESLAPGEFDRLIGSEITRIMTTDFEEVFGGASPLPMPTGGGEVQIFEGPVIKVDTSEAFGVELFTANGAPRPIERGDDVVVIGSPILLGDRELTIAVSSPLQPVRDSVARLRQVLLVTVPLLVLAIAAATWFIVGRALRPVEAITDQVDRITSESLDQRVPQPSGRDELSHLATTMNRMLERLEVSRNAQRQFISDASHELRSPITATQATLEVARRDPTNADWPTTSAVLFDENRRLAGLVDDLLLSAQLDEAHAAIDGDEVDLDEVCGIEADRPHRTDVHVRVETPARVSGNLGHITRAVRNLVENASRHATSTVDIIVSATDGHGVVEVLDDGAGIAAESLDIIFDRFVRLDESRHRTRDDGQISPGGAGLGLAITRQIAEAHGGTVTAANRTGDGESGARFILRLPLAANTGR